MDAETTTGFKIDDVFYAVPEIAHMNMGEAKIFFDYCGYGIEEFMPGKDGLYSAERLKELEGKMNDPAFRAALMHIAYRREHPDASHSEIGEIVSRQSNTASFIAWLLNEAADAGPPSVESTPPPSEPSPSTTDDSPSSSGTVSTNGSDARAETLANTGVST